MKIDGVDVTAGEAYIAGEDYETDVLVLGREMADAAQWWKAQVRPVVAYHITDAGSAVTPFRLTRE